MKASKKIIEFIAEKEGFRKDAYKDQAGIWTIGYGTTVYPWGEKVKQGDVCFKEDAAFWLEFELDKISRQLTNWSTGTVINQNQFDALVSLIYNIGFHGFKQSTLAKSLRAGKKVQENYFTRWNKVTIKGKKVLSNGLLARRRAEWNIWSANYYSDPKPVGSST